MTTARYNQPLAVRMQVMSPAHARLGSLGANWRSSTLSATGTVEFRSAVREFISLRVQAQEADRVKAMERAMVGRKADGLDFFPTPAEVADQMVDVAGIEPDMAVLEPSASMGHLADRIRAAGAEPDVVELSGDRRELLEEKGFTVVGTDFMQMKPHSFFTYGDVFRAPDGKEGVMRDHGGIGSDRLAG